VPVRQDRARVEIRTVADDSVVVLEAAGDMPAIPSLDFSMSLEALYA